MEQTSDAILNLQRSVYNEFTIHIINRQSFKLQEGPIFSPH